MHHVHRLRVSHSLRVITPSTSWALETRFFVYTLFMHAFRSWRWATFETLHVFQKSQVYRRMLHEWHWNNGNDTDLNTDAFVLSATCASDVAQAQRLALLSQLFFGALELSMQRTLYSLYEATTCVERIFLWLWAELLTPWLKRG